METAFGERISMNDVDIQEGTACGSVDVVVGHSSCAKYRKDTAASLSVPSFGMSIIFTLQENVDFMSLYARTLTTPRILTTSHTCGPCVKLQLHG